MNYINEDVAFVIRTHNSFENGLEKDFGIAECSVF